jgi:hypothetical protein
VLVHVAVAMTGLLAFSALSIDLGTLWVARGQAQNAADAAAHAGVVSLAFVNPADTDAARAAAQALVGEHSVWGEPVQPASVQVQVGTCPEGAPTGPGECVRAVVERGGASGSPLPVFFSRIFGASATTVRASASGKVMVGNATNCLRPWAIPDRWIEADGSPWTPEDRYQAYVPGTSNPLPGPRDTYVAPGFQVGAVGMRMSLERADIDHGGVVGDAFYMLDMPSDESNDEHRYEQNIERCNGMTVAVGDTMPLVQAHVSSTETAVLQLVAQDPGAYWDGSAVRNSQFAVSPRIVAVALYDPDALAAQPVLSVGSPAIVRNIAGFFVTGFEGNRLRGVLVPTAGAFDAARPALPSEAAFLRNVALVR